LTNETERIIRINCVGVGRWGPNIVRAFSGLRGVKVGLVCDLDQRRLNVVGGRIPGVRTTTDTLEALGDPRADAVAIATPVETHFELAKRAILAGKHVLVEKPLAKTIQECEELVALARMRERTLAVGHVFLFNAGIRRVKAYIDSGELGRIYYLHATRTNLGPVRTDVNTLWDLGSHDLSIFDHWLRATPEHVSVTGERFISRRMHDVVTATFRYPGGVTGFTYSSWLNPRKVREITVVGEKKMVVWNDMDPVKPVRLYDKSIDLNDVERVSDTFGSFQSSAGGGDVTIPMVRGEESLVAQCAHFIECIQTKAMPINSGHVALNVVRSLTAANLSMAHRGQTVAVLPRPFNRPVGLSRRLSWLNRPAGGADPGVATGQSDGAQGSGGYEARKTPPGNEQISSKGVDRDVDLANVDSAG